MCIYIPLTPECQRCNDHLILLPILNGMHYVCVFPFFFIKIITMYVAVVVYGQLEKTVFALLAFRFGHAM